MTKFLNWLLGLFSAKEQPPTGEPPKPARKKLSYKRQRLTTYHFDVITEERLLHDAAKSRGEDVCTIPELVERICARLQTTISYRSMCRVWNGDLKREDCKRVD